MTGVEVSSAVAPGRDQCGRRLCVGSDQRHQCGGDHLGLDAVWRRRCGGCGFGPDSLSLTGPAASGLATADGDFPITLVAVSATEIQGQFNGTTVAFSIVINGDGTLTVTQNVALEHLIDGSTAAAHDNVSLAGLITATVTITDADGDTASGGAQIGAAITFDDDGPSVTGVEFASSVALDETSAGEDFVSGPISATSAAAIISATTLFGADGAAAAASVLYSLSLTGPAASGLATADGDFPITLVAVSATEIQGQFNGTTVAFSIVINGDGTLTVTQSVALERLIDGSSAAAHDDTLSLAGLITATVTITDADGDTASGGRRSARRSRSTTTARRWRALSFSAR